MGMVWGGEEQQVLGGVVAGFGDKVTGIGDFGVIWEGSGCSFGAKQQDLGIVGSFMGFSGAILGQSSWIWG